MNKRACIILSVFALILSVVFLLFSYFGKEKIIISQKNDASIENDDQNEVKEVNDENSVTLLFGGDAMFDRYIRQISEKKGYAHVLSGVRELMQSSDCAVLNMEGPITQNVSISQYSEIGSPENYVFTFEPRTLSVLQEHNVCLVNIGNNHINNFGREGIEETKKEFVEKGLSYIGDTGDENEKRYAIKNINGVDLGFVNYNAFAKNAFENTISDIEKVRDASDFVILYTHWGEEYEKFSRVREQELAHAFVDVGADLIIGSHPHVVQNAEVYKGKMIYYSLGNFVFDQYFSLETTRGLAVSATFDKKSGNVTFAENDLVMQRDGTTNMDE